MTRSAAGRRPSSRPSISVRIEERGWRHHRDVVEAVRRAGRLALAVAKKSPEPNAGARRATVLLSSDEEVRELNGRFRNRREPTNVLAFPALAEAWPYCGDLALAYGVVTREAKAQHKSLAAHAAHLTVHGVLHLLGYDHHRTSDAKVMESLEILLLRQLGFENPYQPVPVRRLKIRNKITACPTIAAR